MSRRRTHPVEFTQYCYKMFGKTKGTLIMASDEAYMVWHKVFIESRKQRKKNDMQSAFGKFKLAANNASKAMIEFGKAAAKYNPPKKQSWWRRFESRKQRKK